MLQLHLVTAWALATVNRLRGREPDRGDVPGWVMVTVMTAGLVVVIFAAFRGPIVSAITDALDSVTNGTK
ncbi:MAG: hypothetical protein ABJA87_04415 [bacterium]